MVPGGQIMPENDKSVWPHFGDCQTQIPFPPNDFGCFFVDCRYPVLYLSSNLPANTLAYLHSKGIY